MAGCRVSLGACLMVVAVWLLCVSCLRVLASHFVLERIHLVVQPSHLLGCLS